MNRTVLVALALTVAACSGEPLQNPQSPVPSSSATAARPAPAPEPPAFRLPATVAPRKMVAALTVVPTEDTFSGSVEIDLDVKEATRVIWLHGVELSVAEASLEVGGARRPARVVKGGDDLLGFVFDEDVPRGAAKLRASYTGKILGDGDRGLFREKDGEHTYLFTQFEATSARRAFPCFDEPGFKIPWQLTLTVKAADTVLSNTRVLDEKPSEGGMKTVRFAETKPLPSYLVAFAIGPFDLVDAGRAGKNQIPLRFAVPRGAVPQVKFAAGAAGKVVDLLEETFGLPFPYEKLDYVVIPHLLTFGAMENVGLITVGAKYVLVPPGEDTGVTRQDAVTYMAHETAHQWFGDLVTPAFWDDIWLNEGFATWMEDYIVGRFDPSFGMELEAIRSAAWVKGEDGLVSARKVRQEVASSDDISNAFDGITYQKGGAVLGMFEAWLGAETFRKGVRVYLERFSHGNATSNDFLTALGDGAGKDVKSAFSTFLDQPGVPIVASKLVCDASGAKLSLSQERFLPIGSAGAASESTWQIPVCAHYGAGKGTGRACALLTGKTGELPLPAPAGEKASCPAWVMPNAAGKGYYYSMYSKQDVAALLSKGEAPIPPVERLSVVMDLRALAANGRFPLGDALPMVSGLLGDESPHVQAAAAGMLGLLRDDFVDADLRPNAQRFVSKLVGPRARALGLVAKAGEGNEVRMLRRSLASLMTVLGDDPKLLAEADALTRKWLADPKAIEAESVDMVLRISASRGDARLFDRLLQAARAEKDTGRLHRLLAALGGFRDPALAKASLGLVLDGTIDARSALNLLWNQQPQSRGVVWSFMKERWAELLERVPVDARFYLAMIPSSFCDEASRADVEAFFKDRAPKIIGAPRAVAQTLEAISLCMAQKKAHAESLRAFLKKQ